MKYKEGDGVRKRKTVETKTMELLAYEPKWAQILHVCIDKAKRTKNRFAGAWVFWGLKEQRIKPPSNLRKLTGKGILEKIDSARGGKRAYYMMPDIAGVERALNSLSL